MIEVVEQDKVESAAINDTIESSTDIQSNTATTHLGVVQCWYYPYSLIILVQVTYEHPSP